ncbi:MAG: hypothetical protein CMP44_02905 [Rickettsiales bacterium]|jgi:hypothetical protein|nr:hypothetical protein [Rickettsiales bacterium]|tara:strand:+ start:510 stop:1154 length:645 start_codon:yes stop_codon:yes gene_type:complete
MEKTKYYISTGDQTKMFTLCYDAFVWSSHSKTMVEKTFYIRNLSTDWETAVANAKSWIGEDGVLMNEDKAFDLNKIIRNGRIWKRPTMIECYQDNDEWLPKKSWFKPSVTFPSKFIGEVGEEIIVDLTFDDLFGFDTQFGFCVLRKFKDDNGNIFTTTSNNKLFNDLEIGDIVCMKVKVKQHKEYRGENQTVFSYPNELWRKKINYKLRRKKWK